jgi:NitT/TauT family transport system substrate-binding protein
LRKLIAVRREAVDYIYAHRDEAEAIYAEGWGTNKNDVKKFFPKYFSMPDLWSRGNFVKAGLDAMSTGLQLDGEITAPVDWSKAIDQEYLPADLQKPL